MPQPWRGRDGRHWLALNATELTSTALITGEVALAGLFTGSGAGSPGHHERPIPWRRKMALRPQYSVINSEFNDFLFASLGEEKNGIELTVLSALTRLDIDPWIEAARLADLPREAAARALAAAIAMLPEGDWRASDASVIAARLVGCLPRRGSVAPSSIQGATSRSKKTMSKAAIGLVCALLAAAALLAALQQRADPAPERPPTARSSIQR